MKKKIPMLLALAMSVASLAACNLIKNHEHTFGESWTVDANQHWHAATCEHGEEKKDAANHADADENGKCDVCEYEIGHTHTFSEEWSKDDAYHWYAATCSHTDEKSNNELHTDANEDGVCDVCEGHVHLVNDAGYCEGCDTQVVPIDENDVEAVINAALSQYVNINGGTVDYTFTSITRSLEDEEGKNPYANLSHTAAYTFGNGAAYVERFSDSEVYNKSDFGDWTFGEAQSLTKTWFYTEGNEVKGFEELIVDETTIPQFVTADEDSFAGYYFAVSTLVDGWGAETVLFNLYTLSQEDSAIDYVITHNADDNMYTFSFNSLIINTDTAEGEGDSVRYYETSVCFGYSDNYALTSLDIKCDAYTNDAGTNTGEADVDYDYDQTTKTITMRDTAEPDTYTFAVTQTVGERTYVHDKDINEYLPKSFTFDAENGAELEYDAMNNVSIGFDAVPTESFDIVKVNGMIDATLTCTEGESKSFAYIYISPDYDKSIEIQNIMPGTYTLAFTYLDETVWSVTLTVTTPLLTGDYVSVDITDNNTFEGQLISFEAPASGSYTFNIPAGYGAIDKDEYDYGGFDMSPYVDANFDSEGGSFTVDIAQGDVYEFYLSAPTTGTHNITYTFVAKEVVSGGDNDEGDFNYQTVIYVGSNTLYFSKTEVTSTSVTRSLTIENADTYKFASDFFIISIADENNSVIPKNSDYTYTLEAGNYTITISMTIPTSLSPDFPYSLKITSVTATKPTPVGYIWAGEPLVVTVTEANIASGYIYYSFTPYTAGAYVFTADCDCIVMQDDVVIGTNEVTVEEDLYYLVKLDVSSLSAGQYTVTVDLVTA